MMRRTLLPIVIGSLLFCVQEVQSHPRQALNVCASELRTVFAMLEHGGEIYIGTVQTVNRDEARSDAIERGTVSLDVERTVLGRRRVALTLNYATPVALGATRSDYVSIWPNSGLREGMMLLCVLIPDGYDPISQPAPAATRPASLRGNDDGGDVREGKGEDESLNVDGAASQVHVLAGPHDTLVEEFEEIARLFRIKGSREGTAALSRAVDDPRVEVARYVADALMAEVAPADPAKASVLLKRLLDRHLGRGKGTTSDSSAPPAARRRKE